MVGAFESFGHQGWLVYNCEKWHLRPASLTARLNGDGPPSLDVKVFLNRHGEIHTPRLAPYSAVVFKPTPTNCPHRLARQWLELSEILVRSMHGLKLDNYLLLPPQVEDVRAWQWAGYAVRVRYTYLLDLPVDLQRADQSVRNRYRRALDDGYVCRRADNMADVMACLSGTEERKGLHLALMRADLERAAELMGGECLRTFVCYSPEGKPVSTQVLLFVPGAPALDWLAGTLRTHLHRGVSQLLTKHAFDDVHACGAASIDLVGANIPSVSTAKANWGARLVPFFRIEPQGFPQVFRNLKEWVHFHRGLSLPANGSPAENGKATAQARLKHTPAGAATPRAR